MWAGNRDLRANCIWQQHLKPFVWQGTCTLVLIQGVKRGLKSSVNLCKLCVLEQTWGPWKEKDVVLFTKMCYLLGKPCAQGIVTPTKAGGERFSNLHKSIIQTNSMPEYEWRAPRKEGRMATKDLPPVSFTWATFWCMDAFCWKYEEGWMWVSRCKWLSSNSSSFAY